MSVKTPKIRHPRGENVPMAAEERKTEDIAKEEEFEEVEVDVFDEGEEEEEQTKENRESEEERLKKIEEEISHLVSKKKSKEVVKKYLDLYKELEEVKEQRDDYLKTAQMVQANFENYKKRIDKDQEWANFRNKQKILQKFLTIFDDVERTYKMIKEHEDVKKTEEAISLILQNFQSTFESLEVTIIEPTINEKFNPQFHEAIHMIEKEDQDENTIVEVLSKGFLLNDLVIRPSRVVITKKPLVKKDSDKVIQGKEEEKEKGEKQL
ncbi:MAG: nucleotide exchange factor GrpE [Candidatus Heimdallarchaeaceae archaeon]